MPSRRDIFINKGIYHIFNKTIDHKNIFTDNKISEYFLSLLEYYRSAKTHLRFSKFRALPDISKREELNVILNNQLFRVEILCYCLMPNHFHLLIRQKQDMGVVRFMSDILNAVTRYCNNLNNRTGPLFLTQFRSRVILSREQLIHVSRYIHLNPYSGGMITNIEDLEQYPLSSFKEYLSHSNHDLCTKSEIVNQFKTKEMYREFVKNNANYQKSLEYIKHVEEWK